MTRHKQVKCARMNIVLTINNTAIKFLVATRDKNFLVRLISLRL